MPLPFFVIPALIFGSGSYAIKKGYDSYSDNKRANALNNEAQRIVEAAKKEAEKAREEASSSISALGQKKG